MRVSKFEKFATTLTSIAKQEKKCEKIAWQHLYWFSFWRTFVAYIYRCQTYYVGRMKYANLELCKIVLSADSLDRLCLFIS